MKKIILHICTLALLFIYTQTTNAQWMQTNGPLGGTIECFATNGNRVLAGTFGGGVFLSTDSGNSWKSTSLQGEIVHAIAINGNIVFAGCDDGDGVFLSMDSGNTWMPVDSGFPPFGETIISLAFCGSNIFAGSPNHGAYLSSDTGKSWKSVNTGLPINNPKVSELTGIGNKIFAACTGDQNNGGLFSSTDSGSNWTIINGPLGILGVSGGNIFASGSGGIYLTTDTGNTWTVVNDTIHDLLAISGNNIFAVSGVGVYLSTDSARTWSMVNNGFLPNILDQNIVNAVAISGSNILAGTFTEGVFLSADNGKNWKASNNGLAADIITSFAVYDNNLFTGTYGEGVFLLDSTGNNWIPVNHYLTDSTDWTNPIVLSLAANENYIYEGTFSNVFESNNPLIGWNDMTLYYGFSNEVNALATHRNCLLAGTSDDVYLTCGGGWSDQYSGLSISSFAISGNNIFTGTNGIGAEGVFYSIDNDSGWSPINNGLTNLNVVSLAVCGNNIFAATEGGVFVSTNFGGSWTAANNGLKADSNYVIALYVVGNGIFAGTYNGVFLSLNNGSSWFPVNEGFPTGRSDVDAFAVKDGYIYAATQGNSVWKRPLSDFDLLTGIKSQPAANIPDVALFPNPAPNQLTIHTSSFHNEAVTVSIMNVLGQETSPPAPLHVERGDASIDVSQLPSGMYFLQLKSESGSVVKKFVKE